MIPSTLQSNAPQFCARKLIAAVNIASYQISPHTSGLPNFWWYPILGEPRTLFAEKLVPSNHKVLIIYAHPAKVLVIAVLRMLRPHAT